MGKGKNKSQSITRKLKRGNIDMHGNVLSRPFNNSKGSSPERDDRKKFYFSMKEYLKQLKEEDALYEEESIN